MIEVEININRDHTIQRVQAIRIYPTQREPKPQELCRYRVHVIDSREEPIGFIEHIFGDALGLSIKMLSEAKDFYELEANDL